MRKFTTFVILFVLIIANFGFAHENDSTDDSDHGEHTAVEMHNYPLSKLPKDEFLFAVEPTLSEGEDPLRVSDLKDLTLVGNEIYLLLTDGRQLVYNLDGTPVIDPQYPLIEHSWRFAFEEENGVGYSLEIANMEPDDKLSSVATDAFAIYTRDPESGDPVKKVDAPFGTKNFRLFDDQIAYRLKGQEQNHGLGTRFLLHTLADSDWDESKIFNQMNTTVKSFDFSPEGTQFSYIGAEGPKKAIFDSWYTWGQIQNGTVATSGSFSFGYSEAMNDAFIYTPWDMVTTDHGFVVLLKADYSDAKIEPSFLRYYSSDGILLHEARVNHCVKKFAQTPDDQTLYLRMNEELKRLELMRITWSPESSAQESHGPRPLIAERSFGDQTLARYHRKLFGQLKSIDPITEEITYRASIHSDKALVRLEIPYEDIRALCIEQARGLQIEYSGIEFLIPMSLFDCDELLAEMPCQTEATIEIQLHRQNDSILVLMDLYVVECKDSRTKLIHRARILEDTIALIPES